MFCPHTIIYNSKYLYVVRHEKSDYHHGTPLGQRLNPLRYQITIFPRTPHRITINKGGRLNILWSTINWYLWKRHVWRYFN